MATQDQAKPKSILLPILAELRLAGDGSYHLRPVLTEANGETWILVKEAARILKWPRSTVHEYLGDFLVYERPLKRKPMVLLESVVKLREALRDLDFWECQAKQSRLRAWVFQRMRARQNV